MGRDNEFSSISLSPSILKWHKMSKEFVAHSGNKRRKSAELPHCCLGELSAAREEVSGRESHFLLTQHCSAIVDKAGSFLHRILPQPLALQMAKLLPTTVLPESAGIVR